jgi:hypothetical protein
MEYDEIQRLYIYICKGFNEIKLNKYKTVYFKHHTHEDRVDLKLRYLEYISEAESAGIKKENDYIDFYIKKKWWSSKKEAELGEKKIFLENLKKTRDRLLLPSQKQKIQEDVDIEEAALASILEERKSIINFTAEHYAEKKYNRYYLLKSLFKDDALNEKFADHEDEFLEIDDDEYVLLWSKIHSVVEFSKTENIKYLAASGFFQNLLLISGGEKSAINFYGKPVVSLSINQIDLFSYASFYRNSINNSTEKIPDYILSDPNQLIDWCEQGSSSNYRAKKLLDRTPNKNKNKGERSGRISSIVGANSSDYESLGMKGELSKVDFVSDAGKSGGELGIYEVIKKTDNLK